DRAHRGRARPGPAVARVATAPATPLATAAAGSALSGLRCRPGRRVSAPGRTSGGPGAGVASFAGPLAAAPGEGRPAGVGPAAGTGPEAAPLPGISWRAERCRTGRLGGAGRLPRQTPAPGNRLQCPAPGLRARARPGQLPPPALAPRLAPSFPLARRATGPGSG